MYAFKEITHTVSSFNILLQEEYQMKPLHELIRKGTCVVCILDAYAERRRKKEKEGERRRKKEKEGERKRKKEKEREKRRYRRNIKKE